MAMLVLANSGLPGETWSHRKHPPVACIWEPAVLFEEARLIRLNHAGVACLGFRCMWVLCWLEMLHNQLQDEQLACWLSLACRATYWPCTLAGKIVTAHFADACFECQCSATDWALVVSTMYFCFVAAAWTRAYMQGTGDLGSAGCGLQWSHIVLWLDRRRLQRNNNALPKNTEAWTWSWGVNKGSVC